MTNHRPIVRKLLFSILLLSLVLLGNTLFAQDGKALFQSNCATCHNPFKDGTGPALKGVSERVPDKNLLHAWVHNSAKILGSGNPYFNALFNRFNKTSMTVFGTSLSDKDIDAIINYVETAQPPQPPGPGNPGGKTEENDNTLLYGILTLILAIIMFVLLQVNSSLKKLSDDKEGIPAGEPIPFYRNKVYIALTILVLFIVGGFYL